MLVAITTNNHGTFTEVPTRSQNSAYCQYVKDAGFSPVLVPMESNVEVIADVCDALLLPGGIDIDPMYYGYSNQASFGVDPEKDAAERALLNAFMDRGKKIFGICRGAQLVWRQLIHALEISNDPASKYFNYMENLSGHAQTAALKVPRKFPSHYVVANLGELFSTGKNTKPEKYAVNSMHHQVCVFNHGLLTKDVLKLKTNTSAPVEIDMEQPHITGLKTTLGIFQALAWSLRGVEMPKTKNAHDEYWSVLEAFKFKTASGSELLCVQWHPEELQSIELLRNFFITKAPKTKAVPAISAAR